MSNVIHLCPKNSSGLNSPKNSLFIEKVTLIAQAERSEYHFYDTTFQFFCKKEIFSIMSALRGRSGCHVVFHRVPSLTILILKLRFPKMEYSLFYWGDDFYLPILPVSKLTRHCLKRSKFREILRAEFPEDFEQDKTLAWLERHRPVRYRWLEFMRKFHMMIALYVASKANLIYSPPKMHRYAKYAHFKVFGRNQPFPSSRMSSLYADIDAPRRESFDSNSVQAVFEKKELNFLVCHGGQATDNVMHSLCLLEYLAKRSDVKVNILGYLSYSGGSDEDRDALERVYRERASRFAHSVKFERNFLSLPDLRSSFQSIDVAFISAYRDEGVTLFNMLSQHGKILSFNRFSINYDYFKAKNYAGLISHEELIATICSKHPLHAEIAYGDNIENRICHR
jgi:hypothetical protein